jgi:hypothetical protein
MELELELEVDCNVELVGYIVELVDYIVKLVDCILVLVDCIVVLGLVGCIAVVVANTIEELVDYRVEHHIDPRFVALIVCHLSSPNKIR